MRKRNSIGGFTLIEVLIALMIAVVGIAATVRALGEFADSTAEVEQRMLAGWVAENSLTQTRFKAKYDRLKTGAKRERQDFAGVEWQVKSNIETTDVEKIYRVTVSVTNAEDQDDRPLAVLTTAVLGIK